MTAKSGVSIRAGLEKQVHKVLGSSPVRGVSSFEDLSDDHLRAILKKKKKGGTIKRKAGGTAKKHAGGGFDARLDESLAARHPAVRGNLAARRAESEAAERARRRGAYSGASTMVKKGGSVRRKKGSTVSRKAGGKIMVGYKAGGKV